MAAMKSKLLNTLSAQARLVKKKDRLCYVFPAYLRLMGKFRRAYRAKRRMGATVKQMTRFEFLPLPQK